MRRWRGMKALGVVGSSVQSTCTQTQRKHEKQFEWKTSPFLWGSEGKRKKKNLPSDQDHRPVQPVLERLHPCVLCLFPTDGEGDRLDELGVRGGRSEFVPEGDFGWAKEADLTKEFRINENIYIYICIDDRWTYFEVSVGGDSKSIARPTKMFSLSKPRTENATLLS